jgi:hypothetical protein
MQRYFTVFSRELNVDSTGQQRINLNNTNLEQLKTQLDAAVGADISNFIMLVRAASGPPTSIGQTINPASVPGITFNKGVISISDPKTLQSKQEFKNTLTMWSLINTRYISTGPTGGIIPSPFQTQNKEQLRTNLTTFLDKCSITGDLEIPARININSCPGDLLTALGINETDVEKILQYRPTPDLDPNLIQYYKTPAWLITEADILPSVVSMFSNYITTYSQVFRFQVVGYYEYRGPQVRLEVVVDANNGRPRILHWRDLTDLGKGYHFSQGRGSNTSFRGPSEMLNRRWN